MQIKQIAKAMKYKLYFIAAGYFKFFASIQLKRWNPRVIVVTGSSGKTTLLHLIEAQLGDKAHFSHHANSAFGIPFDILGLKGVNGNRLKWLSLFLIAPFKIISPVHDQEFYVAEVDAERPNEAPFLATLLKPEVSFWVSSAKTHSMHYDKLIADGTFGRVEDAIAHEYLQVALNTKEVVFIDGDAARMVGVVDGQELNIQAITRSENLKSFKLKKDHTEFELSNGNKYLINQPQPENVFLQVAFVDELLKYLNIAPDFAYKKLKLPPGRSNYLKGIKDTTIIDSSYNANYSSMRAVIDMFAQYPSKNKWLVIGDMLEQGESEQEEHEKLVELIERVPDVKRVVFLGPRVVEFTMPKLKEIWQDVEIEGFENPRDVLDYLEEKIQGKETILFKGARFLEGVIEHLLADKTEAKLLARREPVWQRRREKWGL